MKKILLLVVFFTLFSCSNDDNNDYNQDKLLKSIVEVSGNGSSTTTFFTYNGNKIESIDETDKSTVFTYTDNLITEAIILDKKTQKQNTIQYIYDNGQLVQIVSSENYEINYIHNPDGTVSYEKLEKDSGNNEIHRFHGDLYFQNGNLTKDERAKYDPDPNVQITESVNFEYDAKINPMHNVLGFDKLLDYGKYVSPNNSKSSFEISSTLFINEEQVISSGNIYYSTYKYDSDGYPTEVDTEIPFLENGNSKRVKTLFYYK